MQSQKNLPWDDEEDSFCRFYSRNEENLFNFGEKIHKNLSFLKENPITDLQFTKTGDIILLEENSPLLLEKNAHDIETFMEFILYFHGEINVDDLKLCGENLKKSLFDPQISSVLNEKTASSLHRSIELIDKKIAIETDPQHIKLNVEKEVTLKLLNENDQLLKTREKLDKKMTSITLLLASLGCLIGISALVLIFLGFTVGLPAPYFTGLSSLFMIGIGSLLFTCLTLALFWGYNTITSPSKAVEENHQLDLQATLANLTKHL